MTLTSIFRISGLFGHRKVESVRPITKWTYIVERLRTVRDWNKFGETRLLMAQSKWTLMGVSHKNMCKDSICGIVKDSQGDLM